MKHLKAVNKYFFKYKWRFLLGFCFIVISNYFGILAPQVTGYVMDAVQANLNEHGNNDAPVPSGVDLASYDPMVKQFVVWIEAQMVEKSFGWLVFVCGLTLLLLALLRGVFMFFMRQTIIVMSRLIEYDQKNEVYEHYQKLDTAFYKTHSTGDLMNRMAEDVSRVRMYTGPAVMYLINLTTLIGFSLFYMLQKNVELTLYVLVPLPILAVTIYVVNTIIHKKSETIQEKLSLLTTNAQESYSGIRVIKSFVQEKHMEQFFDKNSDAFKKSSLGLARLEALYFPAISMLIGLSTLLTIMIGGLYYVNGNSDITIGTIAEFVVYINMLTFPVSAIGWVASMIQRGAASQKRLNEFLDMKPDIQNSASKKLTTIEGNIKFKNVNFVYPNTGIKALKDFNLEVPAGSKVAIIGKTGSGKTTVAQLLLRMYDVSSGNIEVDGIDIKDLDTKGWRSQISYVPQDVFLFSDTIAENIAFGTDNSTIKDVEYAASQAVIKNEIEQLPKGFDTVLGERGVTLSGGQKQRISIARAMIKKPQIAIFDDALSAVDARTENEIIQNIYSYLKDKTAIIITHRIFSLFSFDMIIVLEDGRIVEKGTHEELLALNGYYTEMYQRQQEQAVED